MACLQVLFLASSVTSLNLCFSLLKCDQFPHRVVKINMYDQDKVISTLFPVYKNVKLVGRCKITVVIFSIFIECSLHTSHCLNI